MDCLQIEDPYFINTTLQSGDDRLKDSILSCYFKLYYTEWSKYVHKYYWYLLENQREDLISFTFNDALLGFVLFIRTKGYKNEGASIKTVFFAFCKRKLYKKLPNGKGPQISNIDPTDVIKLKKENNDDTSQLLKERGEKEKEQERLYALAMGELGERCKKLIIWRKLKKWDDGKIAKHIEINPNNVTNEVFRCFVRLKNLVDKLKKN